MSEIRWRFARLWLVAAAGGLALQYSTPNPLPFALIALCIAYFGNKILERLSPLPSAAGMHGEIPDHYVTFELDNLMEDEFKVWFVDGNWDVGRPFQLYGPSLIEEADQPGGLNFRGRTEIAICTTSNWFEGAIIGRIRASSNGKCQCLVWLPYQLAQQVLDDVREDIRQHVTIGFKCVTGSDGKVTYPIYQFGMTKASG